MLLIALTALAEHIEKQDAALKGIEAVGPGLACEVERPKRRGQLEFGLFRKRVHGVLLELIRNTARSAIRPASRTLGRLHRAPMRRRSLKERHAKFPPLSNSVRSRPFQRDADVPRHSTRPIDDLKPDLVAERPQLPVPEVIKLLRQPGQGAFPTRFQLVDRSAAVSGQRVRKTHHQNLSKAVGYRALDNR